MYSLFDDLWSCAGHSLKIAWLQRAATVVSNSAVIVALPNFTTSAVWFLLRIYYVSIWPNCLNRFIRSNPVGTGPKQLSLAVVVVRLSAKIGKMAWHSTIDTNLPFAPPNYFSRHYVADVVELTSLYTIGYVWSVFALQNVVHLYVWWRVHGKTIILNHVVYLRKSSLVPLYYFVRIGLHLIRGIHWLNDSDGFVK